MKRKLIIIMCFTLIFLAAAVFSFAKEHAQAGNGKLTLLREEPITAGAVLKQYEWQEKETKISLIEVNLNNSHVKIDVVPGRGKITHRLNVSAMAENTGAVAAVNADFFDMRGEGAPIGPMVVDKRWVSSPSKLDGIYALGITSDRKAYIDSYFFEGSVTAPGGESFELSGLNKTDYWEEPTGEHSHSNKLHLYDDMWGGKTRGNESYSTPTEMLVEDGRVVEIIEGRYFDFSVPEGKKILRGHGRAAEFLIGNFQPGDAVKVGYSVKPDKNWSMVVGGHSLLVEGGQAVPYERNPSQLDGLRARSAAGISQDGRTLYLVGVEGRTEESKGLRLRDLSQFFVEIGAWKALNLDGGGSTTMVARPLGEFNVTRVFEPEQLYERLVPNAVGIYSAAPQGELKGVILEGGKILLLGEQEEYSLKAYDEYYNPVLPEDYSPQWNIPGYLEYSADGAVVKAVDFGSDNISVRLGDVTAELPVEVPAKDDISSMILTSDTDQVLIGENIPVKIEITTESGFNREADTSLLDWQFHGLEGKVEKGMLKINDFSASKLGFVVARYDGFSAPLPLMISEDKELVKFEDLDSISFSAYPEEVTGSLKLVQDPEDSSRNAAQLEYNFMDGEGTTAAYIDLGGKELVIDSKQAELLLDIYGDGGRQWIRMEVEDSEGSQHRLDWSVSVDWEGWKTKSINFEEISFPVKLKRIYAVDLDAGKGERAGSGTLLFKDLRIKAYKEKEEVPKLSLQLEEGNKEYKVNEEKHYMDVAPRIIEGRTIVPIRFISNAFGADVLWDGAARNATVIKEKDWIDLWPDEDRMIIDGEAFQLDVPAMLLNNRTMLPLRAVGDALGLNVHWDSSTGKITLKN